jgi:hypothetical protein
VTFVSEMLAALLPESISTELRTLSAAELVRRYELVLFLLVELPRGENALLAPLERLVTTRPKRRARIPTDGLTTLQVPAYPRPKVDPGPEDQTELLARLESRAWFALPLLKRTDEGPQEKLFVGRSDQNDVVLKDRSVSSRHAYFESNEDGSLSLTDVGSTNGTRVNGQSLTQDVSRWLQPMDHIQFGQISTFTCIPAVLRSVIRARSTA